VTTCLAVCGVMVLLQSRNIILIDTLIIKIIKKKKKKGIRKVELAWLIVYRYRFLIIKTYGLLILLLKLCFIRFS